mmetsp:Transcript_5027/g.12343  ORF Transcript_5027/g.12343 Transcript_5027/m.12343 type:complete len:266 (-) Transcript_5027:276-1073(-)
MVTRLGLGAGDPTTLGLFKMGRTADWPGGAGELVAPPPSPPRVCTSACKSAMSGRARKPSVASDPGGADSVAHPVDPIASAPWGRVSCPWARVSRLGSAASPRKACTASPSAGSSGSREGESPARDSSGGRCAPSFGDKGSRLAGCTASTNRLPVGGTSTGSAELPAWPRPNRSAPSDRSRPTALCIDASISSRSRCRPPSPARADTPALHGAVEGARRRAASAVAVDSIMRGGSWYPGDAKGATGAAGRSAPTLIRPRRALAST